MRNLLCAGLRRLVKSRTFLFALLAVLAYTALVVLVCWDHCQFSFSQIQFLSNRLGDGLPVKNGAARLAFWQFLMDLLPTGQSLQVSMLYTPRLWLLPLLSAAVFSVSTGAGLLFFRRRDLK